MRADRHVSVFVWNEALVCWCGFVLSECCCVAGECVLAAAVAAAAVRTASKVVTYTQTHTRARILTQASQREILTHIPTQVSRVFERMRAILHCVCVCV